MPYMTACTVFDLTSYTSVKPEGCCKIWFMIKRLVLSEFEQIVSGFNIEMVPSKILF